jgi:hypothetical protein
MHSNWAHEGLPLLHNSGHRVTALAIKSQIPKLEVERHERIAEVRDKFKEVTTALSA